MKSLDEKAIDHARSDENKYAPEELANMPWTLSHDGFKVGYAQGYLDAVEALKTELYSGDYWTEDDYATWLLDRGKEKGIIE